MDDIQMNPQRMEVWSLCTLGYRDYCVLWQHTSHRHATGLQTSENPEHLHKHVHVIEPVFRST